eukprot:Gregarina_sp_Poly_1__2664@NODE_1728_length_3449_cov_460_761975_g1130_i0_p2_GENE_NODE_1728_length_3449_cov_460_761975_g1130_i0NODE_1728_length_3449_cov_460_761975_g1130_i0_p2_ORF_typecomplete_len180_score17_24DUF1681/PF07933_14/6_6e10_NODE_1728_length_3449_cov_460_761975_g1130_i027613300
MAEPKMQAINLLTKKGVGIFAVTAPDAHGYRAATWGSCLGTGYLLVDKEIDDPRALVVKVITDDAQVAQAIIPTGSVDPVLEKAYDSSRAFALRLSILRGGKNWIGIIFSSHEDATQFESVINTFRETPGHPVSKDSESVRPIFSPLHKIPSRGAVTGCSEVIPPPPPARQRRRQDRVE